MWWLLACAGPPRAVDLRVGAFEHPFPADPNFGGCGCTDYVCDVRHLGSDLPGPVGAPVYPVADGVVIFVSSSPDWGEGNVALFVRHQAEDGPFVALYGHVRSDRIPGEPVRAGAALGTIGPYDLRLADGQLFHSVPHLHLGVHPGRDLPRGPTGQYPDPDCAHPADTAGWVAPLAWLAAHRPARS